ncbi:MAG TPA: nucleotidyltransferase domain-containing protein [Paludibacter sp.]|nr:nucleotidyltransferase domain-containing protein [Paludibacter sp.]
MRLNDQIIIFFKQNIGQKIPDARIFLFGSRLSDDALGGDIDILLLSKNKINTNTIRSIRIDFYKKFGWQKLDLIHFAENDTSIFKQLILSNATEL